MSVDVLYPQHINSFYNVYFVPHITNRVIKIVVVVEKHYTVVKGGSKEGEKSG